MTGIHGGDIYRNHVVMDFSVNRNPLGIPASVERALGEAVKECGNYPDMEAEELKQAVSHMLGVPEEFLFFGNGASELFMAAMHGLRPKKTVIPVPSFYGYEYAAEAGEGEILYYKTTIEHGFCLTEDFYTILTEDVSLLFLANPNNPTGNLIDKEEIRRILTHCKDKGIYVLLDECFIEFCGGEVSMVSEVSQFENLILIRAFTKSFSIPGVRLGYGICGNLNLVHTIKRQLPEWNLSCFAQAAGRVCAGEKEFLAKTIDYIEKERKFLEKGFRQMGVLFFPSSANFILIYKEGPLYERLLRQGILIRDCRNFRGLGKGFYRIAVKTRKENETLLNVMGEEL